MLMGNNHAVAQSVTTNTNDLLQGQTGLFLGSKVFKLSNGDMSNEQFLTFAGEEWCILYCCKLCFIRYVGATEVRNYCW